MTGKSLRHVRRAIDSLQRGGAARYISDTQLDELTETLGNAEEIAKEIKSQKRKYATKDSSIDGSIWKNISLTSSRVFTKPITD